MSSHNAAAVVLTSLGWLLGSHPDHGRADEDSGGAGGGEGCTTLNGDVNADARIDLGDPVTILGHLFLGGPANLLPPCTSPVTELSLPATGQSKCYEADGTEASCDSVSCRGQDGMYSLGCSPQGRFIDGGDGTVLDTCTGLVWQQEPEVQRLLWCEALAHCESLSLAGRDDWRLPNVRELQSLVDYGRSAPAIDPIFVRADMLWSSTTAAGDGARGWFVGFGGGNLGGFVGLIAIDLGNRMQARAVRTDDGEVAGSCAARNGEVNGDGQIDLGDAITLLGHLFLGGPADLMPFCPLRAARELPATGQRKCYRPDGPEIACSSATCPGQDGAYSLGCAPAGRFVDNGDGTVLDTCAGLVWQQAPGIENRSWCEALAYCEGLSHAGRDDWRLPNVRELHSLVDLSRTGTPLDPVFVHVGYPVYWSSTSHAGGHGDAWSVGFLPGTGGGPISSIPKSHNRLTVRAVRTAP